MFELLRRIWPRTIKYYEKRACVSIWLGDIESEFEMDDYLRKSFVKDFGLSLATTTRAESATHQEPVNIVQLLRPASQSRYFLDDVVAFCTTHGIVSAKSVLVLYACEYRATHVLNHVAPLRFLSAFHYEIPTSEGERADGVR
jgi:hypothetical protein